MAKVSGRLAISLALIAPIARASADPYRLRGDVFSSARAPVGLLVLDAAGDPQPWLDAEALVWFGNKDAEHADVLVISMRARLPKRLGDLRVGRFTIATGALRPVHTDGAAALVRLPYKLQLEAFGGMPVTAGEVPAAKSKIDWLVGGRVAEVIPDRATIGLSYFQRNDDGELSDREVGIDAAVMPAAWVHVAAKTAYDLVSPGLSQVHVSTSATRKVLRVELYGRHLSPSRMLPATSLFSVLGEMPSQSAGTVVRWRAAPRLDAWVSTALRRVDRDYGYEGSLRAVLRLDDRGHGTLQGEIRRQGITDASFTGVRAALSVPVAPRFRIATELELAVPDDSRGRGSVWPWGLVAVSHQPRPSWEAAIGVEAGATPQNVYQLDALARLTYLWSVK